jgi:hypothetical protein
MESSTVLAFRIFVMLACLIIVPMAAIFGSAFPDVVKSVLVDRIVAWSTGKPVDSTRGSDAPDGFRAVSPGPTAMAARDTAENSQARRWETQNRDLAAWQAPPAQVAPDRGLVPLGGAAVAGFNQSASFSAPADSATAIPPAVQLQPAPESPYHPAASNPPEANGPPGPAANTSVYAPRAGAVTGALEQPDRFTEMEHKLREYGATYYLLETWGNDGQLYRFHCRMAVAGNPNYTRHFEATDRDPLTAMSQVLQRVEAWRAGQLQ